MRLVFRVLHALMAALFVFAAALQYNDVDIVRWVAMYLAAASVCILDLINRPKPTLATIVAVIALAWSVVYIVNGAWKVPLPALFSAWEMKDQTIVAGREMNGLFIIIAWMAFARFTGRRYLSE
jgi:hypothetical protein